MTESPILFDRVEPPAPPGTVEYTPPPERPGAHIGSYKLLQQIGEGGFGVVFMAEQEQPVRRKVAMKVIKPGMDTKQVVARFEAERQALALMDHPSIAKVLDGGTTESGRPFFVMELVHGVPITKYCDDNHLTPRERLELFVPVCQAVQHAHQKGIIHRDLKPSNILVTLYDGKPVPKVIDFGVAKATEQRLTEKTMFTNFGMVVGTFEYMSPEQAEMSALGVDTRSDIYSLGVLLYELLTGTTPLEHKRLREAAYTEVLRLIKEEEPPRPSTRLSGSATLTAVAAARKTEPGKLAQLLRGELDWIVMKCLEKDRARRYETANGLARDLQRYLADEPVEACPPSAVYRLGKFARKHRRGLLTIAAFMMLLVAGIFLSLAQATVATLAKQEALANEAKAREEESKAQAAAEEARTVLRFFEDKVWTAARPVDHEGGLGFDATLRQAMDAAEPEIAKCFAKQPLVEASVRDTLGETYGSLGEPKLALKQHEKAVTLRQQHLGEDHPDTLMSMNRLAWAYYTMGRYPEAVGLYERTVERRKAILGADHPDTLRSMTGLATALGETGRAPEALRLREQTLELQKAKLGPDHTDTLLTMNNLAISFTRAGRQQEALRLYEQVLELRKAKLGPDHPETLRSINNLASVYRELGRRKEAIALHEQVLERRKAKLGPDHPDTLNSMNNLARAYDDAKRHEEAVLLHEQVLQGRKAKLGPDHPDTLAGMNNLANCYSFLERHEEAVALYQQVLALRKAKLGPDHLDTLLSMHNLAVTYTRMGKDQEAVPLLEQVLHGRKAKLGPDHPRTLSAMSALATQYQNVGRFPEALALQEQLWKLQQARLGPRHPDTLWTMNNVGWLLMRQGNLPQAEDVLTKCWELGRSVRGEEHPLTLMTLAHLGETYQRQNKQTRAEEVLRQCLALRMKKETDTFELARVQSVLGRALTALKKYSEAETVLLDAYAILERHTTTAPSWGKHYLSETAHDLASLYDTQGKKEEAAKWRKQREPKVQK